MKYWTIDITCHCDAAVLETAQDLVTAAAAEAGLEAFEQTATGVRGWVQQELYHPQLLKEVLQDVMPGLTVDFVAYEAENRNWNEEWEQEGFAPIRIEDKLLITDARHPEEVARGGEGVEHISIRVVNAFGDGTHATTKLMLNALINVQHEGKRVLDCGTGTGILGIAAKRLKAKEVVAYDIDEWSVENAKENANRNGVEMQVLQGNAHVLSHVCGLFDVVMANINRNILLEDLATFREVMASGGCLLLSGFLEADAPLLQEAAAPLGLQLEQQSLCEEWCCLTLRLK